MAKQTALWKYFTSKELTKEEAADSAKARQTFVDVNA